MTIEEAEAEITKLKGELKIAEGKNAESVKTIAGFEAKGKEAEKNLQAQYNKGFDKAKNQYETDQEKNFIKKDEVEAMLTKRDKVHSTETTLMKMGVNNPTRVMKMIDEDDLNNFGTEEFKDEDFRKKYESVIVFGKAGGKTPPRVITKDNQKPKPEAVTSESYGDLSASEKGKMSDDQKLALLKE